MRQLVDYTKQGQFFKREYGMFRGRGMSQIVTNHGVGVLNKAFCAGPTGNWGTYTCHLQVHGFGSRHCARPVLFKPDADFLYAYSIKEESRK